LIGWLFNKKEPPKGLEPLTFHLRSDCSAIELGWQ
jgi:hypothetical protein